VNEEKDSYNVLKDCIHCSFKFLFFTIITAFRYTRKGIQFTEKKDTFLTLLPTAIIRRNFRDLKE